MSFPGMPGFGGGAGGNAAGKGDQEAAMVKAVSLLVALEIPIEAKLTHGRCKQRWKAVQLRL